MRREELARAALAHLDAAARALRAAAQSTPESGRYVASAAIDAQAASTCLVRILNGPTDDPPAKPEAAPAPTEDAHPGHGPDCVCRDRRFGPRRT